mgnify:CR=1 FL=1
MQERKLENGSIDESKEDVGNTKVWKIVETCDKKVEACNSQAERDNQLQTSVLLPSSLPSTSIPIAPPPNPTSSLPSPSSSSSTTCITQRLPFNLPPHCGIVAVHPCGSLCDMCIDLGVALQVCKETCKKRGTGLVVRTHAHTSILTEQHCCGAVLF